MSAAAETFTRKAPIYMGRLMRDFDFSEVDAAAIMGNAGHESNGLTSMQEIRPRGGRGGFGWFQWTGSRRNNYEAFCRDAGLNPVSDEANYGFLAAELKSTQKAAVGKTKAAQGLEAKVKAFEMAFERAARDAKHYDSRISWAERARAAWDGAIIREPVGRPPETLLGTGAGLLKRAREHIGEPYRNIQIPKDDPNWKGPWDCAEFMSWLVYQEARTLYGCTDDQASPSHADSYTGAWKKDVERLGKRVSVERAAATVGGILLRYPPGAGKMGHIVLCDGKGGTVEAKGRQYGVVADTVQGRKWDAGILIPGISYDSGPVIAVKPPEFIYERGAPNLSKEIVAQIQEALKSRGFDPGEIDGDFGPKTQAAVAAFQEAEGLVVDGAVGPETAEALGISLAEKVPFPGRPEAATPLQLLILILTLLSKEKSMAGDFTKPGQDVDPVSMLLPLLLQSLLSGKRIDVAQLLAALLGKPIATPAPLPPIQNGFIPPSQSQPDLLTILLPILFERLTGKPLPGASPLTPTPAKPATPPLTTVNGALGQTIGNMLNGRKTAIGAIGLLATTLLPIFFPALAPIASIIKPAAGTVAEAIGARDVIESASVHGQEWGGIIMDVAKPLFAALTGWGVLGKFDKWFNRVPQ